jgi:hypothetical protein
MTELGVWVAITDDATQAIVDHGGRLFLWNEPVGAGWLRDRQSFTEPSSGPTFVDIPLGRVTLLLGEDVSLPEDITITFHHVPRKHVRVEWDGRPWGARGDGGNGG